MTEETRDAKDAGRNEFVDNAFCQRGKLEGVQIRDSRPMAALTTQIERSFGNLDLVIALGVVVCLFTNTDVVARAPVRTRKSVV